MQTGVKEPADLSKSSEYDLAVRALRQLPDHSVVDAGELARQIGVDKLELIQWVRADVTFARLTASKLTE